MAPGLTVELVRAITFFDPAVRAWRDGDLPDGTARALAGAGLPLEVDVWVARLRRLVDRADEMGADERSALIDAAGGLAAREPLAAAAVALVALAGWEGELGDRLTSRRPIDRGWFGYPLHAARHLLAAGGTFGPRLLVDRAVDQAQWAVRDIYTDAFRADLAPYLRLRRTIAQRSQQDVDRLAWDLRESCRAGGPHLRACVAALLWTLGDAQAAELMADNASYVPTLGALRRVVTVSLRRVGHDPLLQHVWLAMRDRPPLDLRRHRRLYPYVEAVYRTTDLHELDWLTPDPPSRAYAEALIAYLSRAASAAELERVAIAGQLVGALAEPEPVAVVRLRALWTLLSTVDDMQRRGLWRDLDALATRVLRTSVQEAEFAAHDGVLDLVSSYLDGPVDEILLSVEARRVAAQCYGFAVTGPPAPPAHDETGPLVARERVLLERLRADRFVRLLAHLPGHYDRYIVGWKRGSDDPAELMGVLPDIGGAVDRLHATWTELAGVWQELTARAPGYGRWRADPVATVDDFAAALTARAAGGEAVAPSPMVRLDLPGPEARGEYLARWSARAEEPAEEDDAASPIELAGIAQELLETYARIREPALLDRSVAAAMRAYRLSETDPTLDDVDRLSHLDQVAMLHAVRYLERGADGDIQAAIDGHELAAGWAQALDAPAELRRQLLFNGGQNHFHRYTHGNDVASLRRAVATWERAAMLPDPGGVVHQSYARALRELWSRTQETTLLRELVAAQRAVTELLDPGDPNRAGAVATYGMDLLLLNAHDDAGGNGDLAVDALRRAVDLARRGDGRNLYAILNNLSLALTTRHRATSDPTDLDEAITALDEAAATAPIGPLRVRLSASLAQLQAQRSQPTE